ncbi:MAG: hypothetical protein AB7U82_35435 [Blastocatellales bacterium]
MKRSRSLGLLVLVVCALTFVTAIAFSHRSREWPQAAAQQEAQAQPSPQISALTYVPPGAPVVFSNLTISGDQNGARRFLSSLKLRVATPGNDRLTSLNLMLFEFDAEGKLRRVDGWVRDVDLDAGKTTELTLPVERRAREGHRLALALERANGAAKRWEADFADLAKGVAAAASGNPPVSPSVRQEQPAEDDTGASLCGGGYRRALALAQAGDGSGITSYTCDQHERSYQFTFNGKVLTK